MGAYIGQDKDKTTIRAVDADGKVAYTIPKNINLPTEETGDTSNDIRVTDTGFSYGPKPVYTSQWETKINDIIDKILNREDFSFDVNSDALYQQYKDKYIKQGKLAMQDAIGQASAMTGGYGNSYAQSVGQQQYAAQLENLNDVVPELYGMAYDKYNQEGQDLYNQYSLLGEQEDRDYSRYMDAYSQWRDERDFEYQKSIDERNAKYENWSDPVENESAEPPVKLTTDEYFTWKYSMDNAATEADAWAIAEDMVALGIDEDIAYGLYTKWVEKNAGKGQDLEPDDVNSLGIVPPAGLWS